MKLKYPIVIYHSQEDGGYIAIALDLKGCNAFGETPEQALANICEAMDLWLEVAQSEGRKIPSSDKSTKGIKAHRARRKKMTVRKKRLRKPLILDFHSLKKD